MERWLEVIEEYNMTIGHREGRIHDNADAFDAIVRC